MMINPCPECNSTEVYYGKVREKHGGLRDEHQVYILANRSVLYADTYICITCGYVRLVLDEESKRAAATELPKSKDWTLIA